MSVRSWLLGAIWGDPLPPPAPAAPPVPEPVRRAPGVSAMALAQLAADERNLLTPRGGKPVFDGPRDVFRIPEPPPGAGSKAQRAQAKLAMDDAFGSLSDYAMAGFGWSEGMGFFGYPYLAELTQRPEYRRMSEILAKEMTRKWVKITSRGDKDNSEKVSAIEDALKRHGLQFKFADAAQHDGWFGRGQIFIDTTGADAEDPDELATPLVIRKEKIAKGAAIRFSVIEPMWIYPLSYNSTNPLREDFYKPATWLVQSQTVHASRLMFFVGRAVPDMLKPVYAFGGLSLSQIAKPYVDNWLRTRQSVSDITHAFSVPVLSTNMQQTLQGGPAADLERRLMLFNLLRDNKGAMAIDKDSEEFQFATTPLTNLDALQNQAQEQMAAVSGIPLVKLLGVTPSGLNANAEPEIRAFYDWVHAQQEHEFDDPMRRCLDIIQLAEFGEIDPDIGFTWVPLWQLDDAAQSTVNKTNIEGLVAAANAGFIDADEGRAALASDEHNMFAGIDIDGPAPGPPEYDADNLEAVAGAAAKFAPDPKDDQSAA